MKYMAEGMGNKKGESNVVYNCSGINSFVATGGGDWIYDGVFHTHSTGHCHYRCACQSHSGATTDLEGMTG